MALISILAFVVVAAVAALSRHRTLDPVGAGQAITKIKQGAGVAVEVGGFIAKLMNVFDPGRNTAAGSRFGRTVASVAVANDDDE